MRCESATLVQPSSVVELRSSWLPVRVCVCVCVCVCLCLCLCVCVCSPLVLPLREQIKTVFFAGLERLTNQLRVVAEARGWKVAIPKVSRYVPDFKTGIHHFCIHAGGRAVIDGIEKNLQLTKEDTAPSRQTLYHYGTLFASTSYPPNVTC
jgi:hypothetical protein